MKIKGKQDIEYWITRAKNGQIIRIYQIDQFDDKFLDENKNPFTIPIYVEYNTKGESIAEILEERDKEKEKIEYLGRQVQEARNELNVYKYPVNEKKWWQFWK